MINNNVEKLINIINPNTLQCEKCKRWFFKNKYNYGCVKLYNICIKCYYYKNNKKLTNN